MPLDYSFNNKAVVADGGLGFETYKAGDVIIKQGFPGDHAYIIKQGTVEVYYTENDLSETHLANLHEGEMFGEQSLLEEKPRNASVRAVTDVVLQILDV